MPYYIKISQYDAVVQPFGELKLCGFGEPDACIRADDLTTKYHIHRHILMRQSRYFNAAFRDDFKNSILSVSIV